MEVLHLRKTFTWHTIFIYTPRSVLYTLGSAKSVFHSVPSNLTDFVDTTIWMVDTCSWQQE